MKKILVNMLCALGNFVRKVKTVVVKTIRDADSKISFVGIAKVVAVTVVVVGALAGLVYVLVEYVIPLLILVGLVGYAIYEWLTKRKGNDGSAVYWHYVACEPYVRNAFFQAAYELRRSGALLDIVVTRETDICIQIVNLGNVFVYQITVHRRDCSEMGQENSHRVKTWMQQKLNSLLESGEVIGANSVTSPFDNNLPLLVVTDAKVFESYYELFVVMTDTPLEYQYGRAAYMRRKVVNPHTQDPQDPLV